MLCPSPEDGRSRSPGLADAVPTFRSVPPAASPVRRARSWSAPVSAMETTTHAVVVGASIAGVLAAHSLADRFGR